GRHRMMIDIVADCFPQQGEPSGLVILAIRILRVGLEMQEVGADRTVAILEPGEDDPVLHLHHLGAGKDRQSISGSAAPWGVPCPSHPFTGRSRLEDM